MARTLELFLVRHGLAEARGDEWPDDTQRPLTAEGMGRMKRSARGLTEIGVSLDIILSSPLVRTKQTAEILADACTPKPPVVLVEALAPGGVLAAVLAEIQKHARRERVAIVGHEPGLGELAARLIGLRHPLELKKGSVVRIDLDPLSPAAPGSLRWLLPPRVLRALGR